MEPIIKSILDTDLYKITMMNFVLELFPKTEVIYKFKNRGEQRFTKDFVIELQEQINSLSNLYLTDEEHIWMKKTFPYLTVGFFEYLKNFRYNPSNVSIKLTEDNNLDLEIKGTWLDTIMFEVPLMAIISELYFKDKDIDYNDYYTKTQKKSILLRDNNCLFAEFGTRRRRSKKIQDLVLQTLSSVKNTTLQGTSNVYFAKKYNIKAIGTYAHEIPMAMSVLEGLRNANYYTLMNWKRVFGGSLGVALPDTFGSNAFLNNFTLEFAKLYDGCRQDSGSPFEVADKIIAHYKKLNIDPMSKFIIFSDNLNVEKAIKIKEYCNKKIKCSFGIGTNMTNSIKENPALNMVIKLSAVKHNGVYVPVVKLGDGENNGKIMGEVDAVRVAKYTFFGTPLDS
jgi:nicotinate phosphoribosyltransferase